MGRLTSWMACERMRARSSAPGSPVPCLTHHSERGVAPPASFVPEVVPLSDEDIQARLRAIACYASQWPVLFGTLDDAMARVSAYSRRVGGERYWRRG